MGPAFECAAGKFPLCHLSACGMSCPGLARLVRVHLPFSHWPVRSVRRCFVAPPKLLCPAHAMRDAKPIQGRAQCHRALGRESAEAVGCNRRGCCWRPRHGAPDIWCPSLPALQSGGMGLHVQGAAVRADTHVRPSRLSKPGSCCMLSGSVPQPLTRRADDCDCAAQEPRLEVGRPRGKHGLPPP